MILLVAVPLAILAALVSGGRLARLAGLSFRYGWVALIALGLQALILYWPDARGEGPWGLPSLLLMGSYALLGLVVFTNRYLSGLPVIGLGFALNLAVMVANGGFMPVTLETLARAGLSHLAMGTSAGSRVLNAKDILLPREATHLWALSDVFVVQWPIRMAFSVGDLLLAVGVFILFFQSMRRTVSVS
ncbi:MAG: hypothetical protein FJZ90_11095 [Chloroflexi bacterium]|nr:hypothetical protein [Chloroflexota bacterium]